MTPPRSRLINLRATRTAPGRRWAVDAGMARSTDAIQEGRQSEVSAPGDFMRVGVRGISIMARANAHGPDTLQLTACDQLASIHLQTGRDIR